MTLSLSTIKNMVFGLSLALGMAQAYGEEQKSQVAEEVAKFTDENAKRREEHIQALREEHLKFINAYYDMKLAHSKEMTALWKEAKPTDEASLKALTKKLKEKHREFKRELEKFQDHFQEYVLEAKNKEFHKINKTCQKDLRDKLKK